MNNTAKNLTENMNNMERTAKTVQKNMKNTKIGT